MKFLGVLAVLTCAGVASAGSPYCGAPRTSYYAPPVYHPYEAEVEVTFELAHPVFNRVEVVEVRERQVFVPAIVTGREIVQREVVEKVRVIRVKH